MSSKNPNHADKSRSDAKSPIGACPLMKNKVQLLPLRYGLVERLDPSAELSLPYKLKSRPLGIRLLRDGWLYVLDNTTGYLHEYRVEQGAVSKFIWKGNEAAQDQRTGTVAEPRLVFSRNSSLHVCFSEAQWTAFKCSQMIKSREDRDLFMQRVELAKADCATGGAHLLTDAQAEKWLAEIAEAPNASTVPAGSNPQEGEDYCWEHQALYRPAQLGEIKKSLTPAYENDHFYLVLKDSIGVMRDLAEEQDTVVGWIESWAQEQRKELKYVMGSYIETLMVISEKNAKQSGMSSEFDEKTTPAQRETVYDYINARNQYTWQQRKNPAQAANPGYGYDPATRAARANRDSKKQIMIEALGDDLYAEQEDDIENLEDTSHAALEGEGLGARGIHDLVRHEEMQQYLKTERSHMQRWQARLERITEDRVTLFTAQEFHLSAWYFDFDHPNQLSQALLTEQNCTRDICRTDESLTAIGEYFHTYPYYVLPAFQTRLMANYSGKQLSKLVKWLESIRNYRESLTKALAKQSDIDSILGDHWTKSLSLSVNTQQLSVIVNMAYVPALSMRSDQWLQQAKQHNGEVGSLFDELDKHSNRGQRLGHLLALRQQGAWLEDASKQAAERYKRTMTSFIDLLADEDALVKERDRQQRISKRRTQTPEARDQAKMQKQLCNQQLQALASERNKLRLQLEHGLSPTSTLSASQGGVRIRGLDSAQQQMLENEIKRMGSGALRGYATQGTFKAAFKSAWLPSLLAYMQVKNAMVAFDSWRGLEKKTFIDNAVVFGSITGVLSAGLSVYQGAHIAMINTVLTALKTGDEARAGALFAARIGKLGLGMGTPISGFATLGAFGITLNNWGKWTDAIRHGTTGEQVGAAIAMTGDMGVTGVSALQAGRGLSDIWMLKRDAAALVAADPSISARAAKATAWATRGSRFLTFGVRLITPWGLAFTGLQIGGEVLYNYFNLNAHQRWLLQCCWGVEANSEWDWSQHYQALAEATLQPVITDQGLQQDALGDSARILRFSVPGQRFASLQQQPLLLTAELEQGPGQSTDVGPALPPYLRVVKTEPLMFDLHLPDDWQGEHSQLLLRLACQPEMANQPLNANSGYLFYRVPLSPGSINRKAIIAAETSPPASRTPLSWTPITPEYLNA
jgi:hypothetical protein